MNEEYQGPYDKDACQFKFKGCTRKPAAYSRRDENTSQYLDACENCARVEYKSTELGE